MFKNQNKSSYFGLQHQFMFHYVKSHINTIQGPSYVTHQSSRVPRLLSPSHSWAEVREQLAGYLTGLHSKLLEQRPRCPASEHCGATVKSSSGVRSRLKKYPAPMTTQSFYARVWTRPSLNLQTETQSYFLVVRAINAQEI